MTILKQALSAAAVAAEFVTDANAPAASTYAADAAAHAADVAHAANAVADAAYAVAYAITPTYRPRGS